MSACKEHGLKAPDDLLFFSHVFPVATGHIFQLFAGIHALLDADGLEIGAPEVL